MKTLRLYRALAAKDLRLLFRNPGATFFAFGWPVLVAVLFGLVFGGGGAGKSAIPVVVVDEDGSADSKKFVASLVAGKELGVSLGSRPEAEALVRKGSRSAAIVVLPGFGEARKRIFWGDPPKLLLLADPTREAESGLLEGVLYRAASEGLGELFDGGAGSKTMVTNALEALRTEPATADRERTGKFLGELDRILGELHPAEPESATDSGRKAGRGFVPVAIERKDAGVVRTGPKNAFEVTFPQGILWGIIGCTLTFGIGLVEERTTGTLVRLRMSPLRPGQVLLGRALACFLGIVTIEVAMLLLGTLVFKVRVSSPAAFALGALSTAVAFVGISSVVSILGKTQQTVSGAGWATMLVLSMLGGGMIPLFAMPEWLQKASRISPVRWAILSLEGGLWRGFTVAEAAGPAAVLVAVGLVTFAIGAKSFRVE